VALRALAKSVFMVESEVFVSMKFVLISPVKGSGREYVSSGGMKTPTSGFWAEAMAVKAVSWMMIFVAKLRWVEM
jgi:hypothetical protein